MRCYTGKRGTTTNQKEKGNDGKTNTIIVGRDRTTEVGGVWWEVKVETDGGVRKENAKLKGYQWSVTWVQDVLYKTYPRWDAGRWIDKEIGNWRFRKGEIKRTWKKRKIDGSKRVIQESKLGFIACIRRRKEKGSRRRG